MTVSPASSGYLPRPGGGTLADVIDIILDKGLVIDAYVRVSLVGIEILTIDARIVIASVDTYLRFAEAVNRLDLQASSNAQTLPDMAESLTEGGAKSKTRGALEGVKETLTGGDDDDKEKSRPRRRSSSRSRSKKGDDE
jgi:gas vesicle structural protein